MAVRRRHGPLPLGHKPRGFQRVERVPTRNGPTAQQSVVGTKTAVVPGVFSSAAGGAGYRTLQAPPLARAPVQPFTFGWFAPFRTGGGPGVRDNAAVPFAAPPAPATLPTIGVPVGERPVLLAKPTTGAAKAKSVAKRSTVFPK